MEDYQLTDELKSKIDTMSHYELCSIWRFASSGNPLIMGETGKYFQERLFKHFGGFTPEISKSLSAQPHPTQEEEDEPDLRWIYLRCDLYVVFSQSVRRV